MPTLKYTEKKMCVHDFAYKHDQINIFKNTIQFRYNKYFYNTALFDKKVSLFDKKIHVGLNNAATSRILANPAVILIL